MKWLIHIIIAIVAFCVGFGVGQGKQGQVDRDTIYSTEVHTIITRDTDSFYYPMPTLCYKTDTVPVKDLLCKQNSALGDSLLQRESKEYKDSNYSAYISGIDARLDSIFIYPRNVYTEKKIKSIIYMKPRKWSIDLQAGYGATLHGLSPYLGFGVSYRLY